MKRLFVFIGLILISVTAFCQPTGVDGKWEFPGTVNIPSGSNFTIDGTPVGGGSTDCGNGLTKSNDSILLGGTLTKNTTVNTDATYTFNIYKDTGDGLQEIKMSNTDVTIESAPNVVSNKNAYIIIDGTNGKVQLRITQATLIEYMYANFDSTGLNYSADYSSRYTDRSLPDVGYLKSYIKYGEIYGINKTYTLSNTNWNICNGLTTGELSGVTVQGDSCLKIATAGKYKITYTASGIPPYGYSYVCVFINNTQKESTLSQIHLDANGGNYCGQLIVSLSANDLIKLKLKQSSADGIGYVFYSISLIVEKY